jgi:hypothetical protein
LEGTECEPASDFATAASKRDGKAANRRAQKIRRWKRSRSISDRDIHAFVLRFSELVTVSRAILTVAGNLYMLVQLRLVPARAMPDVGETDCIRFYRAELERQRDFHRGKWFWSRLLIFAPGPTIWIVGFARAYPQLPFIWLELAAMLILAAMTVPANLRLARKYQRRIEALDTSLKSAK